MFFKANLLVCFQAFLNFFKKILRFIWKFYASILLLLQQLHIPLQHINL
jgi:hypothetical protein